MRVLQTLLRNGHILLVFPSQVLNSTAFRRANMPSPALAQMTLYLPRNSPPQQHLLYLHLHLAMVRDFWLNFIFLGSLSLRNIGQSTLPLHLFLSLLRPAPHRLQLLILGLSPPLRAMVSRKIISWKLSLKLSQAPSSPPHFVGKPVSTTSSSKPTTRVATGTRFVSVAAIFFGM